MKKEKNVVDTFRDNLIKLCKANEVPISEVARQCEIPVPSLHAIAKGICKNPRILHVLTTANFFEVSLEEMLGLKTIKQYDKFRCVKTVSFVKIRKEENE